MRVCVQHGVWSVDETASQSRTRNAASPCRKERAEERLLQGASFAFSASRSPWLESAKTHSRVLLLQGFEVQVVATSPFLVEAWVFDRLGSGVFCSDWKTGH